MTTRRENKSGATAPSVAVALVPVGALLAALITIIITRGADEVLGLSPWLLGGAALLALILTLATAPGRRWRVIGLGVARSARQILPAVPILLLIGALGATWMMSGVVPMMIDGGLRLIEPEVFLPAACGVCAVVSVLTGSSWTTIATIGAAFMGIGSIMGYEPGWVAGAIISGAYFGDKVSPLSDTTVLASTACNVDLFRHIRHMMITTVPAMTVALGVYTAVSLTHGAGQGAEAGEMRAALGAAFNLSPWLLAVPAMTVIMIALRLPTLVILGAGSAAGAVALWAAQPAVARGVMEAHGCGAVEATLRIIALPTELTTGNEALDSLCATGGMAGMLPTIWLILAAMAFGGVMIGSGMLGALTAALSRRLHRGRSLVTATVGSGLMLNATTGDQYISLIIGGNIYRSAYHRAGLRPELLSRSLEDSVSVTSVLIPWNSCGMTQATVLGVATGVYAPFCVFNYLSPLMSLAVAWAGRRLPRFMAVKQRS